MAGEMGVPFLGRIPIEPLIVEASDNGKPFIYHYGKTSAAKAFVKAVQTDFRNNKEIERSFALCRFMSMNAPHAAESPSCLKV